MIVDLPSTSTKEISKRLVLLRNNVGAMAMGRVLTLAIVVTEAEAETAIQTANDATRQHPSRIVVLVRANKRGRNRLDAQVRVGGDAGASEIVVLRMYGRLADHGDTVLIPLLLPDSPIVAWWPSGPPADVAASSIGRMAQRRITDAATAANPLAELKRRAGHYQPGDTDLAWTRITRWRGVLAAALDQAPFEPVTEVTVVGGSNSPSTDLLGAWLGHNLRCPVVRARGRPDSGLLSVRLDRRSGPVDLVRPEGEVATLCQPGQPDRRVPLARVGLAECLAAELRRLDPDQIYAGALVQGLGRVRRRTLTAREAVTSGEAPSPQEARETAQRITERSRALGSSRMVTLEPTSAASDEETVHEAAERRLADRSES